MLSTPQKKGGACIDEDTSRFAFNQTHQQAMRNSMHAKSRGDSKVSRNKTTLMSMGVPSNYKKVGRVTSNSAARARSRSLGKKMKGMRTNPDTMITQRSHLSSKNFTRDEGGIITNITVMRKA